MIAEPASQRVMDNLLTQWLAESPQDASVWVADLEDKKSNIRHEATYLQMVTGGSSLDAEWLNSPPSESLDPVG